MRRQSIFIVAFSALLALAAGCNGPAPEAPEAPRPPPAGIVDAWQASPYMHVFIIDETATPESMEAAAADACLAANVCFAAGWRDRDVAPRSMPMSEAAVSQQVFWFNVNRNTDNRQFLISCEEFPDTAPWRCL